MQRTINSQSSLSPQKHKLLELLLKQKGISVQPVYETQTIVPRQQGQPIPLALNQEGLWFIDRLDPGKANYNVPGTVRLQGKINLPALESTLSEIVRRHEVLRTTFVVNGTGKPVQQIAAAEPVKLDVIDLQMLPENEREAKAKELATEAAQFVFDLAKDPLFRFSLLRLGKEDHVLCVNFHHIIADGWAMGVFSNELRVLYQAFVNGQPSPLPELPVQFGDFSIWQREQIQGEKMKADMAWWRQKLSGKLPLLELPTDHPRPKTQSFRGKHQSIHLDKSLSDAIRRFARREGVSVFMTLLAGFKALLYSYSKQEDIIVGSTFANRNARELENLIGFFVNTLPMRTDLTGDPDFRELLARVREMILDAQAHQELPLAKLVQEIQPERVPGHTPFYDVVFDLLTPDRNPAVFGYGMSSTVNEHLDLENLTATPMDVEGGVARFDIAVFIWDQPEGFSGTFEYSTDLFEPETMARMVKKFETLLSLAIAEPKIRLNTLAEGLDKAEKQQQTSEEKAFRASMHAKLKSIKRRSVRG